MGEVIQSFSKHMNAYNGHPRVSTSPISHLGYQGTYLPKSRPVVGRTRARTELTAYMVDSANPDLVTTLSESEPVGVEFGFSDVRRRDIVFLADDPSISVGAWFLAVYFSWEIKNLGSQPAVTYARAGLVELTGIFDDPWGTGDVNWANRPSGWEGISWGNSIVNAWAGRGRDTYGDLSSDPNSLTQGDGYSPVVSTARNFTQDVSTPPSGSLVPYNGMLSGFRLPGPGIVLSASSSYRVWVPPGWVLGQPHVTDNEMEFKGKFLGYRFEAEV